MPLHIPLLDLAREYSEIAPEVLLALDQVLSRQDFILGKEVSAFETAAAARCGAPCAVGCSSGSDALWLALTALGVGPGQAVVTTPFTFFSTASAILRAGARAVFADIDPETFLLDPSKVRGQLEDGISLRTGERVSTILAVHLYGQAADWTRLEALSKDFSKKNGPLVLIEDAAQAFGSSWGGRPAGSLGETAAFSFYPTKNLGAAGDAGMVTTQNVELAGRLRMLRTHGMRRRYLHEEIGWNCRLDTLQAAVLLVKLQHIDHWNAARQRLAERYHKLFDRAGLTEAGPYPKQAVVLPAVQKAARHVYHQYVIRAARRDELRAFLAARGIGSEIYYPVPLHLQPALKSLGYRAGDFPESERAAAEVLALPIFPQLAPEEQEAVVATIADFYSS